MDEGENWTCPYCNKSQVISASRFRRNSDEIRVSGWKEGKPLLTRTAIVCANDQCKKLTLAVSLNKYDEVKDNSYVGFAKIHNWSLLPASNAKPQPECVPAVLVEDYEEACAIRNLSPKASATLIRRCLQGMIRNFCGISKTRLVDEINELKQLVEEGKSPSGVQLEHIEAIDHVRSIGNIGAHMEKDINVIIDVDPNEAQALIELTELLFEEWYVARKKRQDKLGSIQLIANEKKAAKAG